MLVGGMSVLVLASLLHCWYAANVHMQRGHAAGGFYHLRSGVVGIAIVLLLVAVALIWESTSLIWVISALIAYFFVLPLILVPLLQRFYPPASPGTFSHAEWETKTAEWETIAGVNEPARTAPVANDFWLQLFHVLNTASDSGETSVDVQAGELHRRVGLYPSPNHRMPICCRVMREEMQLGDVVLEEPPKGAGASLRVRYQLPRLTKAK